MKLVFSLQSQDNDFLGGEIRMGANTSSQWMFLQLGWNGDMYWTNQQGDMSAARYQLNSLSELRASSLEADSQDLHQVTETTGFTLGLLDQLAGLVRIFLCRGEMRDSHLMSAQIQLEKSKVGSHVYQT